MRSQTAVHSSADGSCAYGLLCIGFMEELPALSDFRGSARLEQFDFLSAGSSSSDVGDAPSSPGHRMHGKQRLPSCWILKCNVASVAEVGFEHKVTAYIETSFEVVLCQWEAESCTNKRHELKCGSQLECVVIHEQDV